MLFRDNPLAPLFPILLDVETLGLTLSRREDSGLAENPCGGIASGSYPKYSPDEKI